MLNSGMKAFKCSVTMMLSRGWGEGRTRRSVGKPGGATISWRVAGSARQLSQLSSSKKGLCSADCWWNNLLTFTLPEVLPDTSRKVLLSCSGSHIEKGESADLAEEFLLRRKNTHVWKLHVGRVGWQEQPAVASRPRHRWRTQQPDAEWPTYVNSNMLP